MKFKYTKLDDVRKTLVGRSGQTYETSEYLDYLWENLSKLEGKEILPYYDTNPDHHYATIGVGFNIETNFLARDRVLAQILPGVKVSTIKIYDGKSLNLVDAVNKAITDNRGNDEDLQSALDQVASIYSGGKVTQFKLADRTPATMRPIWDLVLPTFDKVVQDKIDVPPSKELAVLISLAYQTRKLIGEKLVAAINAGNRAEAWYEIRYDSNTSIDRKTNKRIDNEHGRRRVIESDMFGLYSDPSQLTPAEKISEYISTLAMFTDHADDITEYVNSHKGVIAANEDPRLHMAPAFGALKDQFIDPLKKEMTSWLVNPQAEVLSNFQPQNGYAAGTKDVNVAGLAGKASSQSAMIFGSTTKNAKLTGGKGNDIFIPGVKADTIVGGGGIDTVSYKNSVHGVTVELDGSGKGGTAEGDTISGITNLVGSDGGEKDGEGKDTLTGTEGANAIFGLFGDDRIDGKRGGDFLSGGKGNDFIKVYTGDVADGGAGDDYYDVVDGGSVVVGKGMGHDTLKKDEASSVVFVLANDVHQSDVKLLFDYTVDRSTPVTLGGNSKVVDFRVHGKMALTVDDGASTLYIGEGSFRAQATYDSDGSNIVGVRWDSIQPIALSFSVQGVLLPVVLTFGFPEIIEGAIPLAGTNQIEKPASTTNWTIAESETAQAGVNGNVPDSAPDDHNASGGGGGSTAGKHAPKTASSHKKGHDPLVVDITGTGLNLTPQNDSGVSYDWDQTQFAVRTGWIGGGTAFLAQDLNEDGIVENNEMFGAGGGDSFVELGALDTDSNGVLNEADADFGRLVLWQDRNGDGISQSNEVVFFGDVAQQINLTTQAVNETVNGNRVEKAAIVTMYDGSVREVASVDFETDPTFSTYVGDQSVDSGTYSIPDIAGYGRLPGLRIAATQNSDLLSAFETLMSVSPDDIVSFDSALETALFLWARVDQVDPASRGSLFDARKLEFLEAFIGGTYQLSGSGSSPSTEDDAQLLDSIWNIVVQSLRARTLLYESASPLSEVFWVDPVTDAVTPSSDFSSVVDEIAARAPTDPTDAWHYWAGALSVLSSSAADYNANESGIDGLIQDALNTAAPVGFSDQVLSAAAEGTLTYVDVSEAASTIDSTILVYGGSNSELFDVRDGGKIVGGGGGDEFMVSSFTGDLDIVEKRATSDDVNALYLGADILTSDVSVSADADGNIFLSINGGAQQIELEGEENLSLGVQYVKFADGTVWNQEDLFSSSTTGTTSDETLFGSSSADIFDGLGGTDIEVGNGGGDTFLFNSGYGQLEVDENDDPSTNDTLSLGSGISTTDVSVTSNAVGDIILTIGTSGDGVTLKGMQADTRSGVETVSFAGGPNWSREDLLASATTGTTGNDTIYGTTGNDTFDGLGGSDHLIGKGGDDAFVYNAGYGDLQITEQGGDSTGAGILQLGAGIDTSDVSVGNDGNGAVILTIGGDQITVDGMLSGTGEGLQSIVFADSTVWSREYIMTRATLQEIDGTLGDDLSTGQEEPDVFDGFGGNDVAHGGGGGDTFIFNTGYGQLEIDETDFTSGANNTLVFGAGIAASGIEVSQDEDGNIVLAIAGTGDQVTLDGMLNSGGNGVQHVKFADTTEWSRADLIAKATTGTAGADTILGTSGSDTIDGHGGGDTVNGRGGADIFVFDVGDGRLEIVEEQVDGSSTPAILQFGSGILPSDVTVARDQDGNATLTVGDAGDQVIIDNMYGSPSSGVQFIRFSDGTIWGRQKIDTASTVVVGTGGDDTFNGHDFGPNTTFDGGGGEDEISGAGGDLFLFNAGYGQLVIKEFSDSAQTYTLRFGAGISPSQVTSEIDNESGDIVLHVGAGSDEVRLARAADDIGDSRLISIIFDDETVWGFGDVLNAVAPAEVDGTTGDDFLTGSFGPDIYDGKGGNDTIEDRDGGGDTYVFNSGYGSLLLDVFDASSTAHNVLQFGSGISSSDVSVSVSTDWFSGLPLDLVLTIGTGGDSVTMSNFLYGEGPQEVSFTGGPVWSREDIVSMVSTGTTGVETVFGSQKGEEIDGKGASGGGEDKAIGGGGGDTFVFESGYGKLLINEIDASEDPENALELGSGILTTDVSVSGTSDGDIVLTIGTSGDQVTLQDMLTDPTKGIQLVDFAGGGSWTRQQIIDKATTGTSSDDTLYGSIVGDTFDGGGGTDLLVGNGGDDIFIFNSGYGHLTIQEEDANPSADNVLELGSGITIGDVTVSSGTDGDIVLTIGSSGDEITLKGEQAPGNGVQSVLFADSTVWSRDQLMLDNTAGTTGADTLYGTASGDTFDGLGGGDIAIGNGGGDTFVFNSGYGSLHIVEVDNDVSPSNTLQFGAGIDPDDITASGSIYGTRSIVLNVSGGSDTVTLDGMIDGPAHGIQFVEFADSTVWDRQDIINRITTGTTGDDTIYSPSFTAIYDGKGGNDTIHSSGPEDTIIFDSGYGHLTIDGGGTLLLGASITPSSITGGYSSGWVLYDGISGDEIRGLPGGAQFANGVVWDYEQLSAVRSPTLGTSGDDIENFFGETAPGYFDGLGGNDLVNALGTGNIFRFEAGYGQLEIDQSAANSSANNTLLFGGGITTSDVSLSADAEGNLLLTVGGSGDLVTLTGQLLNDGHGIQSVQFADGTVWTGDQLTVASLSGTTGDDDLIGTTSGDVFDGLGGTDLDVGNGGGDTFNFGLGYGNLEIREADTATTPNNVLAFGEGILPTDASVFGNSDGSISIKFDNGDQVKLDGMYLDASLGVQTLTFTNGVEWDRDDILSKIGRSRIEGDFSFDDEFLFGTTDADVIDGKGGYDFVTGNGGGDVFVFNSGYYELQIDETDSAVSPHNVLQLGADISALDLVVTGTSDGNLVLTIGSGDDIITIVGMLLDDTRGVQEVAFSDGTAWDRQDLIDLATTGTAEDDTLYGTQGSDTFDGAGGTDVAVGYGGDDSFIFNSGYGQLEIDESDNASTPNNVLQLGTGITTSDVTVTGTEGGDLVLTIGVGGDQVTLDGMLLDDTRGVQGVSFDDGPTWDRQDLIDLATTGTSGNESLYGSAGSDTIDGLGGDDVAIGNAGDDTFVFESGYGQLEIDETDTAGSPNNVLQLGTGITTSDVTVKATVGGDIVLTIGVGGDEVTLDGMLLGDTRGVQGVSFNGGPTWDRQDLIDKEMAGSIGNDVMFAADQAQTFDGLGGDDIAIGLGGGDTFVFNSGYGQLEINEFDGDASPNNVLQLGSGITTSDVTVSTDGNGNTILTIGVGGDQVVLDNEGRSSAYGVQAVAFNGGPTWTRDQLVVASLSATVDDDTLYGSTGADTFDGLGGYDLEIGNGGDDTFIFNSGYGQLEIDETDTAGSPNNVLELGTGINTSNVSVTGTADGDLILTIGAGGDQVVLDGMLLDDSRGVQGVSFNGGPTWDRQDLIDRATTGTVGDDVLYGTPGADTFDGGGGEDLAVGKGGDDIYVFNSGYGQLEIDETDSAGSPDNVLQLGTGITTTDVTVGWNYSGDVILTIGSEGDQVILDEMLLDETRGVQGISFNGGPTWTRSDIISALPSKAVTGLSDYSDALYGFSGPELFDGLGGGDTVSGGGGDDTYVFKPGYGELKIDNTGGSDPHGKLQLGSDFTDQDLWFLQSGNDLVVQTIGGSDAITVADWFSSNDAKLSAVSIDGGEQVDSGLNSLISAMATFASANPAFDPAAATSMPTDTTLQTAIAAAWH